MNGDWLRTGDIGWMDAEGKVTITDRKKDLIIVSGYNVYPNEVESVIASNPKVLEVGVIGEKSKSSDETIKADDREEGSFPHGTGSPRLVPRTADRL